MPKFERENRYLVIKNSDLEAALETFMTGEQQSVFKSILRKVDEVREARGVKPLEAAVVESDWPEYECVWGMVQARVENPELSKATPLVLYCNSEEDRQDLIAAINLAKPGMIAKSVPDQQSDDEECCCGETEQSWRLCPIHGQQPNAKGDV